ncbi:MAG: ketopantoate reductase family protein [Candidatus Hydrogenedentes bacterium]|jgi:2-dehydropantoate 2-reductase|nr:ketopantoate reductase family protein [Candidatus Hydrogenedentota bacterium]
MRILVMGAGALGSVAGGFLARAGHEVHLVGRQPHMDAIKKNGLVIEGIWGTHHIRMLTCADFVEALPKTCYDYILVSVKSYDTAQTASLLLPVLSEKTWVCSYQNGLGNAELLAKELGWKHVLGARVIFGARMVEAGRVEVTVIAAPTAVGGYGAPQADAAARALATAMDEAGLPSLATDRIETILWSKVAYNCALNPLSALFNVPYGALAENADTREAMDQIIHEIYAVAAAKQVVMDPDSPEAFLTLFYTKMVPPTAAHYASMREDLHKGRRTEIDALNGAIVQFGKSHNLACPANSLLTLLIHSREKNFFKAE